MAPSLPHTKQMYSLIPGCRRAHQPIPYNTIYSMVPCTTLPVLPNHALSKDSVADFNHHPASVVHSTVTPRVDWKSARASLEKVECIGKKIAECRDEIQTLADGKNFKNAVLWPRVRRASVSIVVLCFVSELSWFSCAAAEGFGWQWPYYSEMYWDTRSLFLRAWLREWSLSMLTRDSILRLDYPVINMQHRNNKSMQKQQL